ncbi:hypothetical protein V1504DRAFT_385675, partial [Lipomyces starkeyi]
GKAVLLFIVLDLIYVHLSLLILFTSPLPSFFIAINLRFHIVVIVLSIRLCIQLYCLLCKRY